MIFLLPDSQSQLTAAPSTVLSRPAGPASRAYGGCATSFSCSHATSTTMVLTARSWGGAALRVVRAVVHPRPHPHLAPHRPHARPPGALLALLLSAMLAACGGGGSSAGEAPTQAQALSARAQLGEKLF